MIEINKDEEEWIAITSLLGSALSLFDEIPNDILHSLQPVIEQLPPSVIPVFAQSIPSSVFLELSNYYASTATNQPHHHHQALLSLPLSPQPSMQTLTTTLTTLASLQQSSPSSLSTHQWEEFTCHMKMTVQELHLSKTDVVQLLQQTIRTMGTGTLTDGNLHQFITWFIVLSDCIEVQSSSSSSSSSSSTSSTTATNRVKMTTEVYHRVIDQAGLMVVLPLLKEVIQTMIEVGVVMNNDV